MNTDMSTAENPIKEMVVGLLQKHICRLALNIDQSSTDWQLTLCPGVNRGQTDNASLP